MILPAAKEEGKMLKKRYAVFNHKGKMTEMKGFELKRRGELQLVKIFQSEVFRKFLVGKNLQECYNACGEVAEQWFSILDTKAMYITDDELIDYISESKMLSKTLEEYKGLKSTSVTCAKRLAEMSGDEMLKDKGLNVKFIISKFPISDTLSERVIPVAVFQTEPAIMRSFIRKWCKNGSMTDFDMRSIIDWDYYKERVGSVILKIVTIPAALQGCQNPFDKIKYPEWLNKKVKEMSSVFKQKKLSYFLKRSDNTNIFAASSVFNQNIEDIGKSKVRPLTEKEIKMLERKKEEEKKKEEERKRIEDEENNPIPITQDYQGWLRCQKRFWRKYRKQRKADPLSLIKHTGIMSMMKGFDNAFYNSTLQIMQVQKTQTPGILRVWVRLNNNQMYPINMEVHRKIYINSKVTQENAALVKMQLPRDRSSKFPNNYLYEVEQKEGTFIEKLDDLMHYHLSNPNIDGVYETQIPLEYRVVLNCGNFVKPNISQATKTQSALNRTYKIKELAPTRPANIQQFNQIDKILIYYSFTQNRNFVGVFIPSSESIYTYVVSPVKINKDLSNVDMRFRMAIKELEVEDQIEYTKFENKTTTNINDAFKEVDAIVKDYKNKHKVAFLTVVHTSMPVERMISNGLTCLNGEVPYTHSIAALEENEFPALDWVAFTTKYFCLKCSMLEEWYLEKINFSNYAEIPIGNLHNEFAMQIIDVLYSRLLIKSNHLLWYSDTSLPDLGGNESIDFRRFFDQFDSNTEMTFPGFYRTYCIEFDISFLCVNAIMNCDQGNENLQVNNSKSSPDKNMEEDKTANKISNEIENFESCFASFQKLKLIVQQWMADIKDGGNLYANVLLSHIYRWLSSGEAKLHDPLLFNYVNNLIQVTFTELMKKFES